MAVSPHPEGATLAIHVQPRGSSTAFAGIHDGALRVRVAAPPVDGKANDEIVRFLSKQLRVPKADVEIISGQTGRRKVVLVRGLAPEALRDALRDYFQ